MLVAMNQADELVLADTTLSRTEEYRCPACQGAVHLKRGAVLRPHFAHYQKEACAVFSEGETAEHLQGKLQLAAWLEALNIPHELEAYLPALQQRPDLLVTTPTRQIAVEFQCSPIAIEQVVARTMGYLAAGYEVVWLLGEQFKYRRQLTAFQKACLTQVDEQIVLFHYSVAQKRLAYRYGFQLQQNQKMTQRKRTIRYGEPLALRFTSQKAKKLPLNYTLEHQKIRRQCQYPSAKMRDFLQLLYNHQETIISMPKELYVITPSEWMLQAHPLAWKYQLLLQLETYPIRTVLTERMLETWLQTFTFHEMPQLTLKQKWRPLIEFLDVLVTTGILKQIRPNKWALQQYPQRFQTLECKFL